MFVRQKKNKSGVISIQIISKSSGKYKVVKTIGSSKDSKKIDKLFNQAKQEIDTIQGQAQFNFEINKEKDLVEVLFSTQTPGVIYPYPQITVFNGDGGMEFPMIVNDGQFSDKISDVYVTTHEIAHMYFPFYVRTNETRYGWMDEGMAYFLPWDLQIELSEYDHRTRAAVGFSKWAGNEMDIPMILPSILSLDPHLSLMSYYKPALAYEMLKSALGEELYASGLKEFINRWNGKHPTPWDFFYTFEDVAKKDLSWFWNPWFFESHIPDLAIKDLKIENGKAKENGLPTVNYMASRLNLSSKYISDLLKQETGKTALELIHLHMISEAKNMLVAGDKSISEIAYQLGFENPPYFSRLFRKEVGMSPKEYKNQILN